MTREQAIEIIRKEYACVDADCDIERSCGKCELHMPSKEPILKAYEMAISALNSLDEVYAKGYNDGFTQAEVNYENDKALSQEPCTVSVSEKEPNEITEEVTLRFFKNSLKVRWHDFVIYNVEWLKKNWQMEMDIVCGVKPCDDAISRDAVLSKKIYTETEEGWSGYTVDADYIEHLPTVTQKSGKWINKDFRKEKYVLIGECSVCGRGSVIGGFCSYCGCRMVEPQESEE